MDNYSSEGGHAADGWRDGELAVLRVGYRLRGMSRALLDALFPQKRPCLFCGRTWEGLRLTAGLCPECLLGWGRLRRRVSICPRCGSFDAGSPCRGPCAGNGSSRMSSLRAIIAAVPYRGNYRRQVMIFKYHGQRHLAAPMAHLMAAAWRIRSFPELTEPCLVPVPMHTEKEAARGFNQSRLLAEALGRELGYPVRELLCRPVAGKKQAGLDRAERLTALDQVFRWTGGDGKVPGMAIIVDDVVTTGATLESCGQILLDHGCERIWGLTFAGGSGRGAPNPLYS